MKISSFGLRTVIYKVGEIAAAKKWYAGAFETLPYFDEPYYVGFNIGGYELGLQPEEEIISNKQESVVVYWGVHDMETEFERFVKLGATVYELPQNVGEGIITASLKDPWGNIIGLIQNPHFRIIK